MNNYMTIEQLKKECNLKYVKLLEMLKTKCDMKVVHSLIIEIAESLLSIGQQSFTEKEKCKNKAIYLVKLAKGINSSTQPDELYYQLTGTRIEKKEAGELESIRRELDGLQNRDGNLISKKELPRVVDLPNNQRKTDADSIRPEYLDDYIGQDKVKLQLKEAIDAAKLKEKPLEHILLFGSAGLGKTSLSKIVANEMNSNIIIMSGPTIKDPMSLVSVIKDVKYGDIVFIDEIHRINPLAAEAIYTVMEDFELSYLAKDKDGAKNVTLKLPPFTIIGATTHSGLLEKPMRDRFTLQFKLDLYSPEDLKKIAILTMNKLGKTLSDEAALSIARRSRGVPRNCNSFVKRIYDRALVRNVDDIDKDLVDEYFNINGIDENGLTDIDIQYLKVIYEKFGNKPVGIDNLSSCLGEGKNIIESQIEPYLLYLGLIQITQNGRMLTTSGLSYIIDGDGKKKL
jgi:Holliday junction DNA helicase RuvB